MLSPRSPIIADPVIMGEVLRINVITRIEPGRGLARDLEVLRAALAGRAVVRGVEMTQSRALPADINIFCEVPIPKLFQFAPVQMLVPNPEFWDRNWDAHLQQMERVLCKTQESMTMFSTMYGWMKRRATFVGWSSQELFDPSVVKERRFFHVGALSDAFKGTDVLLAAWQDFDLPYPLTVVGSKRLSKTRSVTMVSHLPRPAFVREMNRHVFHIVPSMTEGWCHAAHEAAGVGAVLLATDAAPMNDHVAIRLQAQKLEHVDGQADMYSMTTATIRDAVRQVAALTDAQLAATGLAARASLARENAGFVERLRAEIFGTS